MITLLIAAGAIALLTGFIVATLEFNRVITCNGVLNHHLIGHSVSTTNKQMTQVNESDRK